MWSEKKSVRHYFLHMRKNLIFICMLNSLTTIVKLELTKHITPHANHKPLLKQSSSHSHSSNNAMILLVVWSANSDSYSAQASFKVNLLSDDTYQWN